MVVRFFQEMLRIGLGSGVSMGGDVAKLTRLANYIDFIDAPATELPGFWVDKKGRALQQAPTEHDDLPPYLNGWRAFYNHPDYMLTLLRHRISFSIWCTPLVRLCEKSSSGLLW